MRNSNAGFLRRVTGSTQDQASISKRCVKLFVISTVLFSAPSHAYIDPGTGSIILQGLLASIAVGLGVVRTYWHRIRTVFSRSESSAGAVDSKTDGADREDPESQSRT